MNRAHDFLCGEILNWPRQRRAGPTCTTTPSRATKSLHRRINFSTCAPGYDFRRRTASPRSDKSCCDLSATPRRCALSRWYRYRFEPPPSRALTLAVSATSSAVRPKRQRCQKITRRLLMLDTFRKRDNLRPPTPNQPGSRTPANPGVHAPSPAGTARTDSMPVKPVLLDPPAPTSGLQAATPAPVTTPAPTTTAPVTTPAPASATETTEAAPASSARLIVGPGIRLKGADITDCDTIIVEGEVDASMDSRVVEIAEQGVFRGKVEVDIAEIRGRFEGELIAHKRLVVHETGRAAGKIRYGKISVKEGGEVSGDIAATDGTDVQRASASARSLELRTRDATSGSGPSPAPDSVSK
ncbi:MAG: bactofilin family protein [Burkholderiales bacterium]